MNDSTMHCDVAAEPYSVQLEAKPCAYCHALFQPRRQWEAYCSTKCRNSFNVDFGAHGRIASVRRINRGASIVVHLEGPAAERALKMELKDEVLLVKRQS